MTEIKPFFEKDNCRLYHGDCLKILSSFSDNLIDAVITDPPYSSGGLHRGDRMGDPASKYFDSLPILPSFSGDNRDQHAYALWCSLWLSECFRITKNNGYIMCFSDWRQLPLMCNLIQAGGYIWRGIVVWNKGLSARAPHKGYFRHQCEYIVWGTKGKALKITHDGPLPGCITAPVNPAEKRHITAKPIKVIAELCRMLTPCSTILDPFCGSGTALKIAQTTGLKCIGIELEPAYCQIAQNWLNEKGPL